MNIEHSFNYTNYDILSEWIPVSYDKCYCKLCLKETVVDTCMGIPIYDYCPFCGNKMDNSKFYHR